MSTVDPHEAERELRDEPPTPGRKTSTFVGDPQHPAETAPVPERDRDE